jgi:glycosyltransferase involved in cell wall biosynthesis
MSAAWLAGVPVRVYHLHGLRFLTLRGPRRLLLIAAERLAARLATQVVCVSHSCAALASACALAPDEKLKVLLSGSINGVDAERFRPASAAQRRAARAALGIPAEARVIGFVGRLVRDKGIVELAQAWQALRAQMPDLRLVLVGPFEPQDPVPAAVASQLRDDPRVTLAGVDWDTPPYYRAFDVVALPTYREGFNVVSLETAAMGLPIVSTHAPGTDGILDGVTGTLVAARDSRALAAALRDYLVDPALRARHGAAARARVVRDFRQESLWRALRDEYLRLLPGEPAQPDAVPVAGRRPGPARTRRRAPGEASGRRGVGS